MKQRARDQESKEARRQQLLDAAWGLLDDAELSQISVSDIARAAGLAKGTTYLYFKTKEAVFLALLEREFLNWLDALEDAIGENLDFEPLVDRFCQCATQEPKLMRLAAASNAILEQNISYEVAAQYKKTLALALEKTGASIDRAYPQLEQGAGAGILVHSYALILGLWQMSEPPRVIRDVYQNEQLERFQINFADEIKKGLTELWRGAFQ